MLSTLIDSFLSDILTTNPNPFSHACTTISYDDVSQDQISILQEVVLKGWGYTVSGAMCHKSPNKAYSSNYKIETDQGIYNLRQSKTNSPQTQTIIDDCIQFVGMNDVPVARIINTCEGNTFFAWNDVIFSLTEFIEGEYFEGTSNQLIASGELLAMLHSALQNCPYATAIQTMQKPLYHTTNNYLEALSAIIHSLPQRTHFDTLAFDIIALLHETIPLKFNQSSSCTLPQQIGHFDFHPHNVLFDPVSKEPLVILDFDFIAYAPRIKDIGIAMHKFSRIFGEFTERKNDADSDLLKRCKIFLESYHRISPITDQEIEALPQLVMQHIQNILIRILTKHYIHSDLSSDFDLEKHVTQLYESLLFHKHKLK